MAHDEKLTRRAFLGAGAAAAGAALWGGGCARTPEVREKYPRVPANDVRLARNGKSVLIVGAGLSGLITGCELIDRGFQVTILEKNASAGGRLRAWREKNFGVIPDDPAWPGHPIEHGTHIVLSFYNNFREFLGRHGLTARPGNINDPETGLIFTYPDGTFNQIPLSTAPAPFHMGAFKESFDKLTAQGGGVMGPKQGLATMAFDAYDKAQVAYLDSVTVEDYLLSLGAPPNFIKQYMDPLWDMGNFHPSSNTSALYYHRFLGSTMGNWKDLFFQQFFRDSTDESIIQPLKQYIVEHGGEVFFNQEVERFVVDGKRVDGVTTRTRKGEWICPVCGEVHDTQPGRCRRCSYDGVNFKPVHADGRTYQADYYLLGVDIPNAKKLFQAEPFATEPFFAPVAKLPTSSIVVVYLWYPRVKGEPGVKSNWRDHFGDRECYMTADFPWLGTTLNLSYLKRSSFDAFDADVVESQIARVERVKDLTNYDIAQNLHADLKALMPGLPDPKDFLVMRWDNFSCMTVGAEANRPSMFTPYDNFLILGDWNALEHNCFLMEKVTVNSRRAVNHLLEQIGQAEGKMTILPSETPNLIVDAVRKLHSPKG